MEMVPRKVFQILDLCCMPWLSVYGVLEGLLHCVSLILNYEVWNAPRHPHTVWLQQQEAEIPRCKKPSVGGLLVVKPLVPRLLSPASTESSDPIIHLMMVAEDKRRSGDLPTAVNSKQQPSWRSRKLSGVQREATPPSQSQPREATPPSACQEIPTEDVASWIGPLVTWWRSRALCGSGRARFHSHREEWHHPQLLQRETGSTRLGEQVNPGLPHSKAEPHSTEGSQ